MVAQRPRAISWLLLAFIIGWLASSATEAANPLVIQLVDSSGKPVGKGWVEIRKSPADEWPLLTSYTDDSGLFSRQDCPNLKVIYVRAVACPYAVKEVAEQLPPEKITIVLEPETPLANACARIPKSESASICVRVRSPECSPLLKTHITLASAETGFRAEPEVDRNGVCLILGIPPGKDYQLVAQGAPGFSTVVRSFAELRAGETEAVEIKPIVMEVGTIRGPEVIDYGMEWDILTPEMFGTEQDPQYKDAQSALAAISNWIESGLNSHCDDSAVSFLERAYWGGEDWILAAVMPLSPHCDGAIAEGVDSFLGEVLLKRPKGFLKTLAQQPPDTQKDIATSAVWTDGGGMSDEAVAAIVANMSRYKRSHRLGRVATLCSDAALKMSEKLHEWETMQANPEVPLTGTMVATACRINTITVILGPPGQERPRTVLLGAETIVTGRQGGRYTCNSMGATGQVRIWPAEPWKGWEAVPDEEPIRTLVIVLGR